MGNSTWLETWQGDFEGCGLPVAPHDGSNPATYVYNANAGTLTLSGVGAHIGFPRVTNQGEIGLDNVSNIPTQELILLLN